METYFTVYKVTNKKNGKFYIGSHRTQRLDDGYMGSGKVLKLAIKKYGQDNFKKEILAVFDNQEAMFKAEGKLVNKDDPNCYNLKEGGEGGWEFAHAAYIGKLSKLQLKQHSLKMLKAMHGKRRDDPIYDEEWRRKLSEARQGKNNHFYGKRHTEEAKRKIGEANSKLVGPKNSQYGTMWITDGSENKKIKKDDLIPEGFRKGRVVNSFSAPLA